MDSDKKPNEDYEVRNEQIEGLLRGIATDIGGRCPPGWGFTLFIYQYVPGEQLFYISSGDIEGNIKSLERHLAMLKLRAAQRT